MRGISKGNNAEANLQQRSVVYFQARERAMVQLYTVLTATLHLIVTMSP